MTILVLVLEVESRNSGAVDHWRSGLAIGPRRRTPTPCGANAANGRAQASVNAIRRGWISTGQVQPGPRQARGPTPNPARRTITPFSNRFSKPSPSLNVLRWEDSGTKSPPISRQRLAAEQRAEEHKPWWSRDSNAEKRLHYGNPNAIIPAKCSERVAERVPPKSYNAKLITLGPRLKRVSGLPNSIRLCHSKPLRRLSALIWIGRGRSSCTKPATRCGLPIGPARIVMLPTAWPEPRAISKTPRDMPRRVPQLRREPRAFGTKASLLGGVCEGSMVRDNV